jgi:hypothetical protein
MRKLKSCIENQQNIFLLFEKAYPHDTSHCRSHNCNLRRSLKGAEVREYYDKKEEENTVIFSISS